MNHLKLGLNKSPEKNERKLIKFYDKRTERSCPMILQSFTDTISISTVLYLTRKTLIFRLRVPSVNVLNLYHMMDKNHGKNKKFCLFI